MVFPLPIFLFLICMSLFPLIMSPLGSAVMLIIISIISSMMMSIYGGVWYSFILFLVYIGGLLILLTYVCMISSNYFMKASLYMLMLSGLALVMFSSMAPQLFNIQMMNMKTGWMLLTNNMMSIYLLMVILLLLLFFAVVRIITKGSILKINLFNNSLLKMLTLEVKAWIKFIIKIIRNKLNFSLVFLLLSMFLFMIMLLWLKMNNKFIIEYELMMMSTCSLSFSVILDSVSLSFSMVVFIISGCVFMFASKYMEEDIYYWRFLWLLAAFVVSMQMLIYSGSLFFMLLGWDGLGITSFGLIIYYQSSESLSAGFQTLMVNRIGDAIIIISVSMMVMSGGMLLYMKYSIVVFILISIAALTKSAQYPFSSWLPAAMAAPTPVSALVHSSTLVTAGIFIIIRMFMVYSINSYISSMLLLLGAITSFLGGWAANKENDLKKIIALSTLSQLGVMVFSLGLFLPNMTLFHLYTHAMFKALLFLAAGSLLMLSFGTQDLRLIGNMSMNMPVIMIIFNISSLCLIAAPFMSAFYSKHMILEMMMSQPTNMLSMIIMLIATIFTSMYVFRTLKIMCWTKSIINLGLSIKSLLVVIPMMILAFLAIVSGCFLHIIFSWFSEIAFTLNFLSLLIQSCLLTGMLVGIMMINSNKNKFLSTLFFMGPLYIHSTLLMKTFNKSLKLLDYGWLEPALLSKNFYLLSNKFNLFMSWPYMMGSLFRSFWVLFFVFMCFFYYVM